MNLSNTFPDHQWQDMFRHHNDLMARLRDVMGDSQSQSEVDTDSDEVQLIHQENSQLGPQSERMVNSNGSVNWFGGGIVTEAMQRLTPIAVGDDLYPTPQQHALGSIQVESFGHFMQQPVIPTFNMEMDNRQNLGYGVVESQSIDVIIPGLMIGDINNQARPTSRTSEDDEVVCLTPVIGNQERPASNRPRHRNNNGTVTGPFVANIRHIEHGHGENVQNGIQASAMVNTANPFAGLVTPSPPTSRVSERRSCLRRPVGSQQDPLAFRRPERNATARVEHPHLANNHHSGFENRGTRYPETQPNYFRDSGFNAASQFAHLSPPPAANEDVFLRHFGGNQRASGAERPRRSNNGFVERRNMSNNPQPGGGVHQDFPIFGRPSRDNPFANVRPPPTPPLNFAFPEGTLSYAVPVISLDQVRERLRERDEAIAGRGPPPSPLEPDGEAELFVFGSPGFAGLNVGGQNGRGDNNGEHNGGHGDGGQTDWERFQQYVAGDFNPPQFRFMPPGGIN